MKAAVCRKYGPPEVLQIEDVKKPVPKAGEVLIRTYASSVNSGDVRIRGLQVDNWIKPIMRLVIGMRRPRQPILGITLAGEIEAIGSGVELFQVGDRVVAMTGIRFGGYAEYATVSESKSIVKLPEDLSYEEAASLPFGATSAYHFLRKVQIDQAKTICIYGASGSVGVAAVQIARAYGCDVTTVTSETNQPLMAELGATRTLAYSQPDWAGAAGTFDIVFDAVGYLAASDRSQLMHANSRYTSVRGKGTALSKREDMEAVCRLYEKGEYQAVIDRIYSLEEIVEAHRYVDTGRKKGNVVIRIK